MKNRFVWVIFMMMALMFASFLAGYTNTPIRIDSLNVQVERAAEEGER